MPALQVNKVTALPGTLQPHSIYFVSSGGDRMELFATGTTGADVRSIINQAQIQTLIDAAVNSATAIEVVDDITARDALTPTSNSTVLVLDASADTTVASGAATYIYRLSNTSWIKISEAEGLDVALNWLNITGRPTSTPAAIDAAVTNAHTHTNKTQLDLIGQDGDSNLTYNGNPVVISWDTTGW